MKGMDYGGRQAKNILELAYENKLKRMNDYGDTGNGNKLNKIGEYSVFFFLNVTELWL